MSASEIKNIITIGASAGGIQTLCNLLNVMPDKLDAAVFAVIHISRESMSDIILHTLKKHTKLNCRVPYDGEKIENNTLYLAPANHHMMVAKDTVLVRSGARENHWRPSIDVLFRSAAAAYDSCVTGIILTGLLDDGTSGMLAIKKSGGVCIVQEPGEAEFADMPNNVLNNVDVDYRVSVSEMGYIINDMFSRRICEPHQTPEDVKREAAISERMSSSIEEVAPLGEVTTLTCPDCGGVLTKIQEEGLTRYRCYTGHSLTQAVLEEGQLSVLEDSLWVAIRMLEERKNLLVNMADNDKVDEARKTKMQRADGIKVHIDRLKKLLFDIIDTN